jgi:hypothetical protein
LNLYQKDAKATSTAVPCKPPGKESSYRREGGEERMAGMDLLPSCLMEPPHEWTWQVLKGSKVFIGPYCPLVCLHTLTLQIVQLIFSDSGGEKEHT